MILSWLLATAFAVPTVAVMDLDNQTGDARFDGAGPGVAAVLTTKLARVEAVNVVERARLQEVLAEVELGQSGAVNEATAARAGELLGADYLVMGTLFTVRLPAITIDLRLVDASTGQVVQAEQVRGEVGETGDEFFVLLDQLSAQVIGGLDVTLGARDRIRLSQVDVERLSTVQLFGEALTALDDGNADSARSLLGQVSAIEPDFTLAAEVLAGIRAENTTRRATIAHEAITAGEAAIEGLRASVQERANTPAPDPVTLAHMSLMARLLLTDGEIAQWLAMEEARDALIVEHHEAMGGTDAQRTFDETVQTLIRTQQSEFLERICYGIHYWPHEAKRRRAEVMAHLGMGDQAIALLIESWQHPGPMSAGDAHPTDPRDWASRFDTWDQAVVLDRQEVQQLERIGHRDFERKARELDRTIDQAERAREERQILAAITQRIQTEPMTRELIDREDFVAGRLDGDRLVGLAAWQAFVDRVNAGTYDTVRDERGFREAAKEYYELAKQAFSPKPLFRQRVAALMTYQEIVPPSDEERAETYRRRLQSTIEGAWR